MTAALLLSILSLALCIFGFFSLRRQIDRKTSAARILAEYREEVYRLIAEIDAATDRDFVLVEERIKTLKKVIEDTDRRISVFMREIQRNREGEALYASLGKGIRAALDSKPSKNTDSVSKPEQPEIFDITREDAKPVQKTTAPKKRKPVKHKKPEELNIKAQIAKMAAQGHSPAEIASKLNLSLSEVDLALNLLNH